MIAEQKTATYAAEDHATWRHLFNRQTKTIQSRAAREFLDGFNLLSLEPKRVPTLSDVNQKLSTLSAWQVVPANGLVPIRHFFDMLNERKFPVNTNIRRPSEIDFSELPDLFHDIVGHVPMLFENTVFGEFMQRYSRISSGYTHNDQAMIYCSRLYWFVIEMGLKRENGVIRPFGGAILTSNAEIQNLDQPEVTKRPFELELLLNTDYDNYKLQKDYFYIDSFDQLFESLAQFEQKLANT